MNGPPDIDIGLVYTHERQWMPRLLGTLRQSCGTARARLILVDNASDDGCGQWQDHFPEMTVVRNARRLLYAANLNRVLEVSTARYTLVMNTDMYFDPAAECVGRMVRFMDEHPQCGVAGCRILHDDGTPAYSARRFQTLPVLLARRFGLGRWMRGTLDRYLYRDRPATDSWACDWLSGCFLVLRRAAVEQAGPFDDGFVKYFEDVDMCRRISRAGWQVMYHGDAYCYHLEARASRKLLSADGWRHFRAYLRWQRKWAFR